MPQPAEIYVVEDEASLSAFVRDLLEADGRKVAVFGTIAGGERALSEHAPDLLLLDVKLPDGDGLAFLERMRERGVFTPAIVMTAFGTVERAVLALRAGASDFLVKPFDNGRLLAAVAAALESGRRMEEVELRAGHVTGESDTSRALIGAGGGLKDVVALLPKVAASDATVLIHGESGTGKELVARAIHASSPRMDGPFVSINCAAIPETLLESELFGFERGAFTGAHAQRKGHVEAAEGGTLFLDEIGDMPLEAQSSLLRVLQEKEITRVGGREPVAVDVRVIAATHRDLGALAAQGRFREDLLYRLNVIPIELPPLRDRRQDIPGLIDHFSRKHGGTLPPPDPQALAKILAYDWPGNVRELENFIERAAVLGDLDVSRLGPRPTRSAPPPPQAPAAVDDGAPIKTLKETVADAERSAVVSALRRANGNKAQAARMLGVSYKTLFNKINEHGIREAVSID